MKPNTLFRIAFFSLISIGALALAQDPILFGQSRMSVDNLSTSGDETSAASTADGMEIIGGFNDYRTDGSIKASFGVSSDGGATWSQVLVRPPAAYQSGVEGDPMACYDRRTGIIWAGAMSFAGNGGIYVAQKVPGANAFQASVMARINGSVDKGWMCAGPLPGQPNTTRLYITYNQGVIWSDNLGATFTAPIGMGTGLGFLPRVGPGGELYVTYWDTSTGVMFKRSLDGGSTFFTTRAATRMDVWGTEFYNPRVPGNYRIPPMNTMAVNPVNGTIIIMYFDTTNTIGTNKNLDLYMVKSTNQGTNWSAPIRLPFRPLNVLGDMFFPWLEYTQDGRLHLHTFDTSYVTQNDGGSHGMLDNDYAYSDDDGATWTKFRLTPASYDSYNDGRGTGTSFLGDYSGIAIADRRVFPVYLDTHTGQAEIYTNAVYNPILRPSSYTIIRGFQTSGTLQSLFLHDADQMAIRNGLVLDNVEPPIQVELAANSVNAFPSFLRVYLWNSADTPNIQQKLLMFNVVTQTWDTIDARAVSTSDANSVIEVPNPQNYITPGSGQIRARLTYATTGPILRSVWYVKLNEAVFLVGP